MCSSDLSAAANLSHSFTPMLVVEKSGGMAVFNLVSTYGIVADGIGWIRLICGDLESVAANVFEAGSNVLSAGNPTKANAGNLRDIGFIFKFLPRKTERAGGQDAPGRNMPAAKFRVK